MNNRFHAQSEVFVEIVRQGSLTEAANELRLSKSNVSQKLAEMEADLDITLLERNTRAINLTPAGEKVYAICVGAVDALQRAYSEVRNELQDQEPQGTVSLSGSNLYLAEFVLPLLPELRRLFPKVRINLIGGDNRVDQKSQVVDLRIRVGNVDAEGANVYSLAPLERALCIHKSLLYKAQNLTDPNGLSALPLILRQQENPEWTFLSQKAHATHLVTSPELTMNSYELCVEAVRAGLGAAVLAKVVVRHDIKTREVIELLPEWKIPEIPVSLVVPLSRFRNTEVRAVTRYLTEKLASRSTALKRRKL